MALNIATLTAYITADTKGLDKGLSEADRKLKGAEQEAGSRSKRMGAAVGAAAMVGVAGAATAAVGFLAGTKDAASDLSETLSKTNVVFGSQAREIVAWSKTSATSFGLSQQAALAAASQFGDMFQQLGFTEEAAAKNSTALVKMAADLGSFHNVDPTDVLDRIGAAMRGEYDSLQQLIPNINAARVEHEALAMTGKKAASELTAQEKATATLAIVQRDGAKATGDFARTADGAANQQRILTAQITDAQAAVGQKLLPAYAALLGFITKSVIPGFSDLSKWVKDNETTIKLVTAAVGVAAVAYGTYRLAVLATQAPMAAMTAAQWLMNTALAANPIGLVIAALAALVAAFVFAWKNSETFRETVVKVLNTVKDVTATVVGFVVDKFLWFAETIVGAAATAFSWVPGLGPKLETARSEIQKFREKTNAELEAIKDKDLRVKVNVAGHYGIDVAAASAKIGFFASGGWTGPGGKYQPAGVVHADEFVVRKESRARIERRAPGLLDHINRTGTLPGYAEGGIVQGLDPARAEVVRHAREGANRTVQTAVGAWAKEMAAAMKVAAQPAGGGGSARGLLPVMARMREFVTRTFGIRNIGGYAYRNIGGTNKLSDHALGKAIDIMTTNPAMHAAITGYFTGPGRAQWPVDNVISMRRIWNARRGGWRPYRGQSPHTDHVHIDTFDRGGLARGMGLLPKLTSAPERVLSPDQTRAFERLVEVLDRGSLEAVQTQPVPVEKHLHYHAATGRSMPEEDFFDAAGRARMLGW